MPRRKVHNYEEQVYAGVLGKIIGVYLGRPFEGWPKAKIEERFGRIDRYVHEDLGKTLVVADDDISGTFTFVRALEDSGLYADTPDEYFGDTWLNYVLENRTIFWWGGVGMSTEAETQKKVSWIKEGAGDRFNELEIEIGAYFTFVMDDPSPVLGQFAQMFGMSEEEMSKHPHALFGSVDSICEELERRRELHGISYITVGKDNMEAFAPVVTRLSGQ